MRVRARHPGPSNWQISAGNRHLPARPERWRYLLSERRLSGRLGRRYLFSRLNGSTGSAGLGMQIPPRQKIPTSKTPATAAHYMELIPGQYLKAVRERLQIGLREVQEASAIIASEEDNDNFYISAARLTQIENEPSIPSVFKLFSLCSVYGLDLHDVLSKFGVNANRVHSYRSRFLPETTRVTSAEVYGFEDKVLVPVRIDPELSLGNHATDQSRRGAMGRDSRRFSD